jgi:hypothetical protein
MSFGLVWKGRNRVVGRLPLGGLFFVIDGVFILKIEKAPNKHYENILL